MKRFRGAYLIGLSCFLFAEILILSRIAENWILQAIARLTGKPLQLHWANLLQKGAWLALGSVLALYLAVQVLVVRRQQTSAAWKRFRSAFFRFSEPVNDRPVLHWNSWDTGMVLFFLACGIFYYLLAIQLGPYPQIDLGGDAANLTSFAAGLDHPDWFRGDALLGNSQNLRSYLTFNVQLIRWLKPVAGTYSLAYAFPILLLVPLNLSGFYLFGRALLRKRFWALLLTLALAVPLKINMGEIWGVLPNAVTRYFFQALIPYLLVMMLAWRNQPARWPWLAVLVGLMSFIHPVSTPGWAAAVWLGFGACLPVRWPLSKKLAVMAGLAVLTLAALGPYLLNYLGTEPRTSVLGFEPAVAVIENYFPPNLLDIPLLIKDLVVILWNTGLLPVSLILSGLLFLMPSGDRGPRRLVFAWLAGLVVASAGVPWLEHSIEMALKISPIQTEMVRGLRYIVFFLVLFSVWSLAEWQQRLPGQRARLGIATLGVILLAAWGAAANLDELYLPRSLSCMLSSSQACRQPDDGDQLVDAIARLTPPGAAIYSTFAENGHLNQSLPVRYQALRSLVFCYKDHGQLITAHSPDAEVWLERVKVLRALNYSGTPENQMQQHQQLARDWGATHLITDLAFDSAGLPNLGLRLLYRNDSYALYELQ